MRTINNYILKKAKEAGICQEWADMIPHVDSVDGFLAMYKRGIDFCLEKNFPSNDDLLRLGGDRLEGHGIFVDAAVDLPEGDFIVCLGESAGIIYADGHQTIQIYIKHTSQLTVIAKQNSFVVIDCFDQSTVDVEAYGAAKVLVNVYGSAQVTQSGTGTIKTIHKNKQSY
jgi:hypothetical protein